MMRLGKHGQSTAEYAVLFALVIGAAIAMQQYVKSRIQGSVKKYADDYSTTAGSGAVVDRYDPARETKSSSGTDLEFQGSKTGGVHSRSGSGTVVERAQN